MKTKAQEPKNSAAETSRKESVRSLSHSACRNTISFAAPAARGYPRTTRLHSIRTPTRRVPVRPDCPSERAASPSGYPTVLVKSRSGKVLPAGTQNHHTSLAETFPERSIAGASSVPFLWSEGAVRRVKAHAEDCLSAKPAIDSRRARVPQASGGRP